MQLLFTVQLKHAALIETVIFHSAGSHPHLTHSDECCRSGGVSLYADV